MSDKFTKYAIAKVDDSLGLVFGYAIVCLDNGQPYYDRQDDHIPEDAMLEAWLDFSKNSRAVTEMHSRTDAGVVVSAFPLTSDIAKALGIDASKTGMLVALEPDVSMLAKFKSGELTGFSIGGARIEDEVVADA